MAYEKRVKVRLLISCWASSSPVMIPFLKALDSVQEPKAKLDVQVVSRTSRYSCTLLVIINMVRSSTRAIVRY